MNSYTILTTTPTNAYPLLYTRVFIFETYSTSLHKLYVKRVTDVGIETKTNVTVLTVRKYIYAVQFQWGFT